MPLILSATGRKYGYLRDKADHRDYNLLRAPITPTLELATMLATPVVDLEPMCGPKKDQGQEGACTAFAGCSMREFLYRKFFTSELTKLEPPPIFSPAFLYFQERQFDGSLGEGDTGST